MSAMKELVFDIYEMLAEGENPQYISKILGVPVSFVYEAMEIDQDIDTAEVYSPYQTVNS